MKRFLSLVLLSMVAVATVQAQDEPVIDKVVAIVGKNIV